MAKKQVIQIPENIPPATKEIMDIAQKASAAFIKSVPNANLTPQLSKNHSVAQGPNEHQNVKFDGATELHGHHGGHGRGHSGTHIRRRIAAVREAYEHSGLIGNSIDLMVDFALEGFTIVHENKPIQRFYRSWAARVDLNTIAEQILKSYFRDGNVPVLAFRGRIKPKEFTRLKKAVAQSRNQIGDLFITEDPINRVIPYAYHVIDVLNLHKVGSEFLGNVTYEYVIPREDWQVIKNPKTAEDKIALERLEIAIGKKDFKLLTTKGRLRIPSDRLDILYYKKDHHKPWANPMLWRVIGDVQFKKLLRDMDISVVESVINAIVIFALGDTPKGFPAPPDMYTKFADILKTATKTKNLIWNDLIKVIAEYPPVDQILGKEKYEQVDADIRAGLGIAEVILNGEGSNFANSFLSVKTLMERLEGGRNALLEWLMGEMTFVAKAMGFNRPAWIKMRHMSLRDEEAEKRLLLELVDRGMVSYETCIERFGENFPIEIQRMKEEDNFRRRNEKKFPFALIKTGKFTTTTTPLPIFSMLDSETIENSMKPKQTPTSQEQNGPKGGRPQGPQRPQQKKETPRNAPVGQKTAASAEFSTNNEKYNKGCMIFDKLYNILKYSFIKSQGLSSLSDEHNLKIYNIIRQIIAKFDGPDMVNKDNIEKFLKIIFSMENESKVVLSEEDSQKLRERNALFLENNLAAEAIKKIMEDRKVLSHQEIRAVMASVFAVQID
jgi:hypothetical protein